MRSTFQRQVEIEAITPSEARALPVKPRLGKYGLTRYGGARCSSFELLVRGTVLQTRTGTVRIVCSGASRYGIRYCKALGTSTRTSRKLGTSTLPPMVNRQPQYCTGHVGAADPVIQTRLALNTAKILRSLPFRIPNNVLRKKCYMPVCRC